MATGGGTRSGSLPIISSDNEAAYVFEHYVETGDPLVYITAADDQYTVAYWLDVTDRLLVTSAVNEIKRIFSHYPNHQSLSPSDSENSTARRDRGRIAGLEYYHASRIARAINQIIHNPHNTFIPTTER